MYFSLVPYLKASYTELCMFLFKLMTFFHFHLFLCKLKTRSRNSTFYLICASNKHFLLRKPISIIMYEWWISHVYSFLYFSIHHLGDEIQNLKYKHVFCGVIHYTNTDEAFRAKVSVCSAFDASTIVRNYFDQSFYKRTEEA